MTRSLSPKARLVFIGMFSLCDDDGSVDRATLQTKLFSGEDVDIEPLIQELISDGLISESHKGVLRIANFLRRGSST